MERCRSGIGIGLQQIYGDTEMIQTNDEKVKAAIAYLRSRGKYLLDNGKWVPTTAEKTDVRRTIAYYREAAK